jgi:hypothetical protein
MMAFVTPYAHAIVCTDQQVALWGFDVWDGWWR